MTIYECSGEDCKVVSNGNYPCFVCGSPMKIPKGNVNTPSKKGKT